MPGDLLDLWYTIREAEFTHTDTDSGSPFPADLDWDTFMTFYSVGELFREDHSCEPPVRKSIVLSPSERDPCLCSVMCRKSTNRLIRSFSGKVIDDLSHERIDILWLSPSAFVSSIDICIATEEFCLRCDYSIMISTHQDSDGVIFLNFYSFSTFENIALQYSDLPLQFFQKITASQPADFFSFFNLDRESNSDVVDVFGPFPIDFCKTFLSIVSSCSRSAKKTTLLLPSELNTDELQVILGHCFDSLLTLAFHCDNPFADSVSRDVVNNLLWECHVPSLHFPTGMTSFRSEHESFAANCSLQSVTLSVDVDNETLDEKMMGALSQNRSIQQVELWAHSSLRLSNADDAMEEDDDDDDDDCGMADLREFLLEVFSRESYIKTLSLHVFDYAEANPDKKMFASIFLKMMDPDTLPTLRNLSFFSVSLQGVGKDQELLTWLDKDNVQGIRNWDQVISPWLVLNFYRDKERGPARGGLVPLVVQAISWGGVYRHTTKSAPSTIEIANAGLIYHVLRRAFSVPWSVRDKLSRPHVL
jgi:hypothetical protein